MRWLIYLILFITSLQAELAWSKFISTKTNLTNLRVGPGTDYPVKWVYIKKHIPLEIIGEYEDWYRIKDIDNEEGWINKKLLSNKLYALTKTLTYSYIRADLGSLAIFQLQPKAIVEIKTCTKKWCYVKPLHHIKTWILQENLWGVVVE